MLFKLSKLWIPHLVVFLHYYFNYCFLNHSFPKVHLLLTQVLSLSGQCLFTDSCLLHLVCLRLFFFACKLYCLAQCLAHGACMLLPLYPHHLLWAYILFLEHSVQFSSVAQSCPTLCNPMDYSTPGFPVHHEFLEVVQTHIHLVSAAIQQYHPLLSPSPPSFNLSQHQGLFKWVSSLHQVAKVLEFQLQHQSFQWVFRTDFL